MHTDASHIFERGADWGATGLANDRVAELILEMAGGELEGELVDVVARRPIRHAVWLRKSAVVRHLGQEIPDATVKRILSRLGFTVEPFSAAALKALGQKIAVATGTPGAAIMQAGESWAVDLPTWRLDIEREIDLIEEIARVYGYNKFANTLPAFSGSVVEQPEAAKEQKVRSTLLALGYNEAISASFISPADAGAFSSLAPVPLANPLSEEQSVMRTALSPGMLRMLAWNLNRGVTNVRLFEIGNVFSAPAEEATQESRAICLGATGNAIQADAHGLTRPISFFDLKGDLETLLHAFAIGALEYQPAEHYQHYHWGRSACAIADGKCVARFGQVHPDATNAFKIRQDVYLAEIDLAQLLQISLRTFRYEPLSRFPAVDRDFSFLFSDSVTFVQIRASVQALNISELRSFEPAEIFRGGAVPQARYSVLLRAKFQSFERTLRDDEVAQWSGKIIQALEALGGSLRAQ